MLTVLTLNFVYIITLKIIKSILFIKKSSKYLNFLFEYDRMLSSLTMEIHMEADFIEGSVRTRLIVAGINELEERGVKDFSLRRVALASEVSCAAPYRHFKDKEDFINEIIKYISSKWELLCIEIESVFRNDLRKRIIELAVSNLRFWIANPNYRSVLMTVSPFGTDVLSMFDAPLMAALEQWCAQNGSDYLSKKYTVRALIYGTLILAGTEENKTLLAERLRDKLEEEFKEI